METQANPMAIRRPRRTVVVFAGTALMDDGAARVLTAKLRGMGIEARYLGREEDARRIATVAAEDRAETIELCLAGGGVQFVRQLLRELTEIGRRDVSIVVRRVD
jgi:methylmalonyl-CoA mutase cobalamin-binding subunit